MQNAVIYARYSSSAQTEQSIEGQLRDCYAFAEREGLTVIEEYIDRAISGRSQRRMQVARNIVPEVKEAIRNTEIPTASVKIRSVKLIKGMYLAISTA